MPGRLAAVDVQGLAGDEGRPLEVEDSVDDVVDLARPAERVSGGHRVVFRGVVHRRLDDAEGDGADAYAAPRILDRERARDCCQAALRQGRQRRRRPAPGVIDEAGRDVDDVAAALDGHLADRTLRDVEEAGEVHGGGRIEILLRVVGERLADEDSGVVDQRVDAPEPVERLLHHARRRARVGDVAIHSENVGLAGGLDRP
jgi:hypothetical protein